MKKMQIIPAIDLRHGKVVRLKQGDFKQQTDYDFDAMLLAKTYQDAGAEILHLVDLDAAKAGKSEATDQNFAVIRSIVSDLNFPVQTGGGIRSMQDVESRLNLGVSRVVIGSLCIKTPELFEDILSTYGAEKIVAAIDVKQSEDGQFYPATHGWQETVNIPIEDVLARFSEAGLIHCLCTDIACDGMLNGPNLSLYKSLKDQFPKLMLQASGGVSSLDDIDQLRARKLDAVILGKSLLEGRFNVAQAIAKVQAKATL